MLCPGPEESFQHVGYPFRVGMISVGLQPVVYLLAIFF